MTPSPTHANQTVQTVHCAVRTISDTRTPDTDKSGALIQRLLRDANHTVHSYAILKDDPDGIIDDLRQLRQDPTCRAALLTGGTGIAARDNTYEAVQTLLDKQIEGFGELFRVKSYDQIGPAAMLSRAVAGVTGQLAVFAMPGSTPAVELAMTELILPTLGHIVYLLNPRA